SFGTEKSKGTKVFALTGKINRTGLVEVPNGIPLSEIIYDIGGGIIGGKKFKAVQTGGPSGGCIPSSLVDTAVDYESLAALGSIVGSGGMVVMDEDTCMVDMARYFQNFCQEESCGKCTPCRVGTKRLLEILERIVAGEGKEGDIELLLDLGSQVKITSLCGLGQTAPNPVITTIKYFRDEYEAHIKDKSCPSCSCPALIHFEVTPDLCTKCGICVKNCPVTCITGGTGGKKGEKIAFISDEECIRCGVCFEKCPFDAIFKYSGGAKRTS
ncbi:MAG: NADH-ubiquinone oxidoreductase-F iron-sulfur binding region domain-containing protein, partial [Deltaproteobacteria bacterium]